jgi:hypothetical protein
MGAQLVSVKASAAPPPGYDAPPDDGGSSLGMAEDVAPPQPLVSNGAGN